MLMNQTHPYILAVVPLPLLNQAYLESDALSRFPEIELYEAVQSWLRHDRRRWRHTDTIIQSVRFCLMTPANIPLPNRPVPANNPCDPRTHTPPRRHAATPLRVPQTVSRSLFHFHYQPPAGT